MASSLKLSETVSKNNFFRRKMRPQAQTGGVIVEAAITIPLLIFLAFSLIDAYFLLSNYFSLNQAMREVVLTAAMANEPKTVNISSSTITIINGSKHCDESSCSSRSCIQRRSQVTQTNLAALKQRNVYFPECYYNILRERLTDMMASEKVRDCAKTTVGGCLTLENFQVGFHEPSDGLITIKITTKFSPFSFYIPGFSFSIEDTGGLANWELYPLPTPTP